MVLWAPSGAPLGACNRGYVTASSDHLRGAIAARGPRIDALAQAGA
jgi:hypothetical protein